jgi:hypothetical protein
LIAGVQSLDSTSEAGSTGTSAATTRTDELETGADGTTEEDKALTTTDDDEALTAEEDCATLETAVTELDATFAADEIGNTALDAGREALDCGATDDDDFASMDFDEADDLGATALEVGKAADETATVG